MLKHMEGIDQREGSPRVPKLAAGSRGTEGGEVDELTFSLKPCFLGPLSFASFFLSADRPDWGAR